MTSERCGAPGDRVGLSERTQKGDARVNPKSEARNRKTAVVGRLALRVESVGETRLVGRTGRSATGATDSEFDLRIGVGFWALPAFDAEATMFGAVPSGAWPSALISPYPGLPRFDDLSTFLSCFRSTSPLNK